MSKIIVMQKKLFHCYITQSELKFAAMSLFYDVGFNITVCHEKFARGVKNQQEIFLALKCLVHF